MARTKKYIHRVLDGVMRDSGMGRLIRTAIAELAEHPAFLHVLKAGHGVCHIAAGWVVSGCADG